MHSYTVNEALAPKEKRQCLGKRQFSINRASQAPHSTTMREENVRDAKSFVWTEQSQQWCVLSA